jgi:hypothetical protein
MIFGNCLYKEKAKPPKGGDAKLRVYSRKAMIAGLPTVGFHNAFELSRPKALFFGHKRDFETRKL